jgi:hypothetical protein
MFVLSVKSKISWRTMTAAKKTAAMKVLIENLNLLLLL